MSNDPHEWMWANALDTLARAERLHRRMFEPLGARAASRWEPPVDVLETDHEVLILAALRERPQSVSELVAAVAMEQSAVSHQLRLLRDIGLIVGERHGRRIVYSLYDDHVASLIDQAVGHVEHLRLGLRTQLAS